MRPGQFLTTLSLDAAELRPGKWLLRVIVPPSLDSGAARDEPDELFIAGNADRDRWSIIAWAPSVFQQQWKTVPGARLPWTNEPSLNFAPAGIGVFRGRIVATVQQDSQTLAYLSTDDGRRWRLAKT
jgi:hypothetical protein